MKPEMMNKGPQHSPSSVKTCPTPRIRPLRRALHRPPRPDHIATTGMLLLHKGHLRLAGWRDSIRAFPKTRIWLRRFILHSLELAPPLFKPANISSLELTAAAHYCQFYGNYGDGS